MHIVLNIYEGEGFTPICVPGLLCNDIVDFIWYEVTAFSHGKRIATTRLPYLYITIAIPNYKYLSSILEGEYGIGLYVLHSRACKNHVLNWMIYF